MAAGDLLPTSGEVYAAELRLYLMADGEDFAITGLSGLSGVRVKSRDTKLNAAAGAVGSSDFAEEWPLIINLRCATGSASTAELALVDLAEAWAPSTTDIELHLWVPGLEHIKVTGRPRDLDPDRVRPMASGIIKAQATFMVLNTLVEAVA